MTLSPGAAVVHGVGAPLGLGSSRRGDSSRVVGAGRMGLGDRYQLPAGCGCGFLPVPGGGCWGAGRAARGLLGPTWSGDSGSSLPLSQDLCWAGLGWLQ